MIRNLLGYKYLNYRHLSTVGTVRHLFWPGGHKQFADCAETKSVWKPLPTIKR